MGFWNTAGKDPKRNFRFKVMIGGIADQTGTIWWAKKATKPNFTVAESKHAYLNHTYYWPGRVEWQTITITFVDPVGIEANSDDGTVQRLNEIFQASGYRPPSLATDLITQSKSKAAGSLGNVNIVQLDAEGQPVEYWTLHNPFIKKISYGELDFENDELTQIEVEFRYDWAVCGASDSAGVYFDAGIAG
jgi:hypothetical protein